MARCTRCTTGHCPAASIPGHRYAGRTTVHCDACWILCYCYSCLPRTAANADGTFPMLAIHVAGHGVSTTARRWLCTRSMECHLLPRALWRAPAKLRLEVVHGLYDWGTTWFHTWWTSCRQVSFRFSSCFFFVFFWGGGWIDGIMDPISGFNNLFWCKLL